MIPTEPEVADNGRYTITEVGRHLKMDYKTVQKYTDQGALKCGIHKATKKKFSPEPTLRSSGEPNISLEFN